VRSIEWASTARGALTFFYLKTIEQLNSCEHSRRVKTLFTLWRKLQVTHSIYKFYKHLNSIETSVPNQIVQQLCMKSTSLASDGWYST
jgi:hypothetical protein